MKISVIGLVIAVPVLIAGCGKNNGSSGSSSAQPTAQANIASSSSSGSQPVSDSEIQLKVVGNWTNVDETSSQLFRSDGSFLAQWPSARTNKMLSSEGTWMVKDGLIVRIMTNLQVFRPAQLYKIPSYKIIEIDDQKMVYQLQGDIHAPTNIFTVLKQ